MAEYSLKYGRGHVAVALPEKAEILTVTPNEVEVITDFDRAFLSALDNPIASRPLSEMVKKCGLNPVCLIVNDSTRLANSERFLPLLINYLNKAGIPDEQMFIVIACGSHRPMTQAEIEEGVGKEIADRIECVNHIATNEDELIYYGETSRGTPVYLNKRVSQAGFRILTGSVVHHFFVGFGGGRKALIPGVAGHKTIQKNHSMMLLEGAEIGKLDGNPVAEDVLEAAQMVGGGFLVNVVLNEEREFVGVFAGDMDKAHREACKSVEKMNGVNLPWQADLVVASCAGYPKDINVYQAQKTLDNAAQAVKPGGHIVLIAECVDGVGSTTYLEWAKKYKTLGALETALKANFVLGGHKAYAVARLLARASVYMVSCLEPSLVRELGFKHVTCAQEAVDLALKDLPSGADSLRILVMPEGSLTVPVR